MQTFNIKGMTCDHCVSAIEAAIKDADPNAQVRVDILTGTLVVANETAPQDVLLEAIAAEGYQATPTG